MREQLFARINDLISQTPRGSSDDYWIRDSQLAFAQGWVTSAANAINLMAPPGSQFRTAISEVLAHEHMKSGVPFFAVQKISGILEALRKDADAGLLTSIEQHAIAGAFDDFLDHAQNFHKAGKPKEASILASAVLEDTIRRIALNQSLATDQSLEATIDALVKAGAFTAIKAKRVKAYAAVRNAAFHAEWEKIDPRDVGSMIEGIRELLDNHFQT